MRKLAWAAGAFSGAVFAACFLIPASWRLYAAAAALLLGLCGFFLKGKARLRVLLAAGFAALGLVWTQGHYALFVRPVQALDGVETTALVEVTDYPTQGKDYSRISGRLLHPGVSRCELLLYDYNGLCGELKPGDRLEAQVRFQSALRRYDEEIWSYAARGVYLTGILREAPRVTARGRAAGLHLPQELAQGLKRQLRRCFPEDTLPFMTALLTGDKALLYGDAELCAAMEEAGLMHVVAISGMHLSFLIGFLQTLLGKRRWVSLLCIPIVVLFVLMTGCGPSVFRSAFMLLALLLAPLFGRENDSPTSLCTVLALLLAVNPQSARGISLQLSFAATAGILLASPRIYAALETWSAPWGKKSKRLRSAFHFLWSSLSTTLGALVFTVPLMALHFGSVSLISPLSNLLCLWAVSLCFSGGMLCCILGAVFHLPAAALAWLLAWVARYVTALAQWLGGARFAAVYTVNPLVALWLAAVYVILALCWLFRGKRGFRPVIPLCCGLCLLLAAGALTRLWDGRDALRFTALDVEQGQCLLLQSGGKTLMLDCGGPRSADVGALAADYVESRFLSEVDVLILTHLHSDHASGIPALLHRMPVGVLILPGSAEDEDGLLAEILSAAQARGTELLYLWEDSILTLGALELRLIAPAGSGDTNERGIVISGRCGDFDFLVTGDIASKGERQLISRYELPRTELLMVGHHGSKYSSCKQLLDVICPETAIISVGGNNYGHPTPEALNRLAAAGARVYRTDQLGSITLHIPK